jgi:hypothetical protein
MREPSVFLLAVAGFLALGVLYLATMKDTNTFMEMSSPGSSWSWMCRTQNDSRTSGEQLRTYRKEEQGADGPGDWPGLYSEDTPDRAPEPGIEEADHELPCMRCHAGGQKDAPFSQEGDR